MLEKNPQVSVIIPTHNRANLLPRAIKSVLDQTYKNFELIIVDDGSIDNTKKVVEEFQKKDPRIRYIWQKASGGAARPRNTGIKQARGEYIAFLDSDDEWLPEKLEKQLKLFESSSGNLGFVGCDTLMVNEQDEKKKYFKDIFFQKLFEFLAKKYRTPMYSDNIFFKKLLEKNFIISPGSIIVKKEVFDKIGFFDENIRSGQDWDMWLRISKKYQFRFIPDFLFRYYIHSKSLRETISFNEEIKLLEYFLNKHRAEYKKYPASESVFRRRLALAYCASGQIYKGRNNFIKSIKLNPLDLKSYFFLVLSFFNKINKTIFGYFYSRRKLLRRLIK